MSGNRTGSRAEVLNPKHDLPKLSAKELYPKKGISMPRTSMKKNLKKTRAMLALVYN